MFIRTLPPVNCSSAQGHDEPEILKAMKGLVTAVLAGIGDEEGDEGTLGDGLMAGGAPNKIRAETVTEQSVEALAQFCTWQLVVGFNLRELEVREEFRASMEGGLLGKGGSGGDDGGDGDVGFGPGALE